MKVLVVTNMYPTPDMPAFGTFIKEQVDSLTRSGVEIDVLFANSSKIKPTGRPKRVLTKGQAGGNIQTGSHSARNVGKLSLTLRFLDSLLHHLSAFLTFGFLDSLQHYLWAFPRLWARLLTRRYDLIHAHYVFSGIIARAQFLYPVVLTHHGSQVFQGWEAPLCRLVSKFVDRTIVMSPEMKARGHLGDASIIPCGINLDFFRPIPSRQAREELGLPQDKKLVVFIGEYYKWNKRWDIAQAAVKILKEKNPDVELVLVSKQPHDVVPKYLYASDALVLVSDSEGSPMVIKEAMACNLPIVAVPVGDVAEVIGGTEGCYLCSQDPHDVAEKLEMALQRGRRTNGRDKIAYLDNSIISQKIIGIYNDVTQQRKSWWKHLPMGQKSQKVTPGELHD
jgi:glycosyltransferase involved in cell wall biosynthesis